eukprot:gene987-1506_t
MGTWLGGIVYDVAPANTRDLSHVYGRAEGPKKKSISVSLYSIAERQIMQSLLLTVFLLLQTLPLSQHIIRLENRDLTEVPQIPASVATLRHLTKLDFSNNSIKLVAPEIGNLPHLEEVLLENNCITSLPEALGRIAALKLLNLNGNPLKANDTSGPHLAQGAPASTAEPDYGPDWRDALAVQRDLKKEATEVRISAMAELKLEAEAKAQDQPSDRISWQGDITSMFVKKGMSKVDRERRAASASSHEAPVADAVKGGGGGVKSAPAEKGKAAYSDWQRQKREQQRMKEQARDDYRKERQLRAQQERLERVVAEERHARLESSWGGRSSGALPKDAKRSARSAEDDGVRDSREEGTEEEYLEALQTDIPGTKHPSETLPQAWANTGVTSYFTED